MGFHIVETVEALGSDADHLKTPEEVDQTAAAGFTLFTLDPSEHVDQQADNYTPAQVEEKFSGLVNDKVPPVFGNVRRSGHRQGGVPPSGSETGRGEIRTGAGPHLRHGRAYGHGLWATGV